jgi:uncharacterized phage protein (TIGR02218 family)
MTQPPLYQALQQGLTSICRAWAITRRDGVRFGFTDHDRPLFFAGLEFRAESGLSAMNLSQTTGLSVDNTEALGVLWDDGVSEADIAAGKFDEAKVEAWLVNWANPEQIQLEFSGLIGEIQRKGGVSGRITRPDRFVEQACGACLQRQLQRASGGSSLRL